MKNPIVKFIITGIVVVAPTIIGCFAPFMLPIGGEVTFWYVALVYFFYFVLLVVWSNFFANEYGEYQHKRSRENKELQRLSEENKELKEKLNDKWDNF